MKDKYNRIMLPVAVDPGGTTGLAAKTPEGNYVTCVTHTPQELADFLWGSGATHLIVENFQAQTIGKYGLYTVRLVGACEAIAHIKCVEYILHVPQDRYPFQQDAKSILKAQKRKFVIHEEDALAHLLRWEYDVRQNN